MENLVDLRSFWRKKKVIVTGHTGFKGYWLTEILLQLGATVVGVAKDIPTTPNAFGESNLSSRLTKDCRFNLATPGLFAGLLTGFKPDIVFHLAAQPIVQQSYKEPLNTFLDNAVATAMVADAVCKFESPVILVAATTDKVYRNRGGDVRFSEDDELWGDDPYSASKVCCEAILESFFKSHNRRGVGCAIVRAGNVLGGGDWGAHRIVPDTMRALKKGDDLVLRNPSFVRPWQHVFDPLMGYLMAAMNLWQDPEVIRKWNFGPSIDQQVTVTELVERLLSSFSSQAKCRVVCDVDKRSLQPEQAFLALDSSKAIEVLGWQPLISFDEMMASTTVWYANWLTNHAEPHTITSAQISKWLDS